jgi:hypothetical protein
MRLTLLVLTALTAAVGIAAAAPLQAQTPAAPAPTFTRDVAPIFYKNCTVCHRPGEIAPMSLLTYREARPWVRSIGTHVARGTMPPWHADAAHGAFSNDRRLSAAERDTVLAWVNAGAPEGNAADLPAQPSYPSGWTVGEPDAVFAMTEDYPVPASGTVEYKYFQVPTNFTEDKWIQAFEVRPGTPAVVHHVIVFAKAPPRPRPADAPAQSQTGRPAQRPTPPITFAPGMEEPRNEKVDAAKRAPHNDRPSPEGGSGSFVGAFTPGQAVRTFNPGSAIKLPAGATLVFQMHYTATGAAATDRSKIGFVFAKEPPKQEVIIGALVNANFTLPAGEPNVKVDAEMTVERDLTVWSILPHTHVRGRAWEITATYPDGRSAVVLAVPNYDFNWQTDYIFTEPLKLPKGTKVRTSAWYDNSRGNKSNPDPSIDVRWGEQTWEEMQFTAFTFTIDPAPASAPTAAQQQ